jgi:hypothetical protein
LEKKNSELLLIKEKQKKDSITLEKFNNEITEINRVLDSIGSIDADLRSKKIMNKQDALSKIDIIESLLYFRSMKIDSLNKELNNLESKFSRSLAIGQITEGMGKLQVKKDYYTELKKRITELETENISLKDIIYQKEQELVAKDSIIGEIKRERQLQIEKLNQLESDIRTKQMELTELTTSTAEKYFQLAKDIKGIADNTSPVFNKKKKVSLLKLAHEYFKKSFELGYEPAKKEYEFIETDPKTSKLLKEKDDKKSGKND